MRIKKLVLFKCIRLRFNDITYFEWLPETTHQIFIGTNGSGKSTVVRHANPLPGSKDDFESGGYKHIEIEHRGLYYIARSEFTGKGTGHHSLKTGEGIELNPGGTLSVQREVVKQTFGMTQALMDVLIGDRKFTQMAALERRDWIMLLSEAQMEFALQTHQRLKRQTNDARAVFNKLTQRLNDETKTVPTEAEQSELQGRCDVLKRELHQLLIQTEHGIPSRSAAGQELQRALARVHELSRAGCELVLRPPVGLVAAGIEDVNAAIVISKTRLQSDESRLVLLHTEADKVAEIVSALAESASTDVNDLDRRADDLFRQQCAIEASCNPEFIVRQNVVWIEGVMRALYPTLLALYDELPDNSDQRFNRADTEKARTAVDFIQGEINNRFTLLGKLNHRLEHMRNTKDTLCPKCGFVWKEGLILETVETLSERVSVTESEVKELQTKLADNRSYITAVQEYSKVRQRINSAYAEHPEFINLYTRINELERTGASKQQMMQLLDEWRADVTRSVEASKLAAQIEHLRAAVAQAKILTANGEGYHQGRIGELNAEINALTTECVTLREQLKELNTYRLDVERFLTTNRLLDTAVTQLQQQYDMCIRAVRNEAITGIMGQHQTVLAHAEQALSKAMTVRAVIDDLTRSRDVAQEEHLCYALLTNELSPVDGLIADSMQDIVKCFANEMTALISQIFTYDLEVLPCGADDGEMDYKFPLSVQNGVLIVPDVAKASSAQVYIVDFAFPMIVMLYLGLQDYPLYLDEPFVPLDEQHLTRAMIYLKSYVEAKHCDQLLLISHHTELWGCFADAEICAMSTDNLLTVPDLYNTRVTMS